MVNIERLKGALRTQGITNDQAAQAMGVNTATFYRRVNSNGEKFTVAEVGKLAELLHMDSAAMQEIFFDRNLHIR